MTGSQIDQELVIPESSPYPSKQKGKYLVQGVLLVLMLAFGVYLVQGRNANKSTEKTASVVEMLAVKTAVLNSVTQYSVERAYTGEIVPRRTSDLGFEQGGTLVEILVEEGDRVNQGDILARIDSRGLQAQRQQLEAERRQSIALLQELKTGPRREDIAEAEAAVGDLNNQLALARLQQQRRESLYEEGAISLEEMQERKFNANALEKRLQQAQSRLDELNAGTRSEQISGQDAQVAQIDARIRSVEILLDKGVLKSPFRGTVASRIVDEGVVVAAGQSVLRLVEDNQLEARIGLPQGIADKLAITSQHNIQVNDRNYPARLAQKLPELRESSRTVTAVFILNRGTNLTVGSTARLILREKETEAGFWLPVSALVAGERGLWSLYTVKPAENNAYQVVRRAVEVIHSDAERALVRGSIESGDRVIVHGSHRVVPNQLVKLSP